MGGELRSNEIEIKGHQVILNGCMALLVLIRLPGKADRMVHLSGWKDAAVFGWGSIDRRGCSSVLRGFGADVNL